MPATCPYPEPDQSIPCTHSFCVCHPLLANNYTLSYVNQTTHYCFNAFHWYFLQGAPFNLSPPKYIKWLPSLGGRKLQDGVNEHRHAVTSMWYTAYIAGCSWSVKADINTMHHLQNVKIFVYLVHRVASWRWAGLEGCSPHPPVDCVWNQISSFGETHESI